MIEAALREAVEGLGLFRRVDGAIELSTLASEPTLAMPAAFVIPDSESAADAAGGTQIFEQLVTRLTGIVIIVGADGARRGAAASTLRALEDAVIGRLAGADMPGTDRPLSYVDARLIGVGGGRVSRLLRFRSIARIRVVRSL